MATPESEYYDSLDPDSQARFHEIISTWKGLGLVGCAECKLPGNLASVIDGQADEFNKGNLLGQLQHYAIELNGLKRPPKQGVESCTQRLDELDETTLFGIGTKMGMTEEGCEALIRSFRTCIQCPAALVATGETPSIEEAKTILAAEAL